MIPLQTYMRPPRYKSDTGTSHGILPEEDSHDCQELDNRKKWKLWLKRGSTDKIGKVQRRHLGEEENEETDRRVGTF